MNGLAPMPGFAGVGIQFGPLAEPGAAGGACICGAEGVASTGTLKGLMFEEAVGGSGAGPDSGVGAKGEPPDHRGLDAGDGGGGVDTGAGVWAGVPVALGANREMSMAPVTVFARLKGDSGVAGVGACCGVGTGTWGAFSPDPGGGVPKAMAENDAAEDGAKGLGIPGAGPFRLDSGGLPATPNGDDDSTGDACSGATGSCLGSEVGAPKLNGEG